MQDPFRDVRDVLREAAGTVFPGAVARVSCRGNVLMEEAVGSTALPGLAGPETDVTPATVYDLASLTKPLATTALLIQAFAAGDASPDDPLARHLPEAAGSWLRDTPIRDLMAHRSGLAAWRPFAADLVAAHGEAIAGTEAARAAVLGRILAQGPEHTPGIDTVYSDLGYLLLGRLAERLAGAPLDRAFAARVAGPLGLSRSFFVPIRRGVADAPPVPPGGIAATERCPVRGRVLRGEVHDDNAWVVGGSAGHAGLFADAAGAARVAEAMVEAWHGGASVFDGGLLRAFWNDVPPHGSTRVPGFDTPSPQGSSAGDRHPAGLVGHLGFTGTSVWIDPPAGVVVVLLTNRVHPTRESALVQAFRPCFHDAVWDALSRA
jgi:CubicO group peptidase (beta-lactamase class C family)